MMLDRMLELRAVGESVLGSGGPWCPLRSPGRAVTGHHGLLRDEDHDLVAVRRGRTMTKPSFVTSGHPGLGEWPSGRGPPGHLAMPAGRRLDQ